MSDTAAPAEEMEQVLVLEEAKTGRSTCRATGEPIEKDEVRVGFETWISGRMAMAYMKPLPFLRDCCHVEYCLNAGAQGSCRATKHKFARGQVRFVCTAGDPSKKMYLSLAAAGVALAPVLARVGRRAFQPTAFQGLADLAAQHRQQFYGAFAVPKSEAAKFDRVHPAPQPPSPQKQKAPGGSSAGRPAKRARVSSAADSAAEQAGVAAAAEDGAAAVGGEGAGSEGATDAAPQEQGLTAYELARLEHIKRNRERMMALNLPALASELMPAAPPKPPTTTKHKGVSRKRLTEVLPRRESSRLRGIAADGSIIHSERQGEVVVVAGEVIRRYASGSVREELEPQERHPQGELQFCSTNCSHDTDETFIQLLAHAAASANSGTKGGSGGGGSAGRQAGKGAAKKGSGGGGGAQGPLGVAGMGRLRLEEDDVAKVTKEATTHLAFHPTTDTLLVACSDKRGNIGLWHVEEGSYELPAAARRAEPILHRHAAAEAAQGELQAEGQEDGESSRPAATSEGAVSLDAPGSGQGAGGPSGGGGGGEEPAALFDGVLSLQPQHYQYICGLRWAGGSGRGAALFTASYDGSLRRLDVERGVSDLVVSAEDAEYSCMDVTGDGRTAVLGSNEGELQLVDVRAPGVSAAGSGGGGLVGQPLAAHAKKVNTVHFEPSQEQVFASGSTDTSVKLWDLRKGLGQGAKPLATAAHSQACQAAMFAPDGSRRVVSTSFDGTVRVWDGGAGLAPLLTIKHDNNTGRWVLPFRAVWNAAGDGVIIGNMNRFVDIFDATTGGLVTQLHGEHMTAIPSRNAVHPTLPVLAAATNSGRIHMYR